MEFHQQTVLYLDPDSIIQMSHSRAKSFEKVKSHLLINLKALTIVPGTMLEVEDKEKFNAVSDLNEITVYGE